MTPSQIICPREHSELTPCIAREGSPCLTENLGRRACIGCGITPMDALLELAKRWPPAAARVLSARESGRMSEVANDLPGLVLGYLQDQEAKQAEADEAEETPLEVVP